VDYAKLVQFLYAGNPAVLADSQRLAMQSAQVNMLYPGGVEAHMQSYGFGLVVSRALRVGNSEYLATFVCHDGSTAGFTSFFGFLPSTGFGIVYFANADMSLFTTSTDLALVSFAGLPAPTTTMPPGLAVDWSLFPSYAGTYDAENAIGPLLIAANGTTLSISIPSFDATGTPYDHVLQPTSMDNFLVSAQGHQLPLTFIADSTGSYQWIRTRFAVGKRVPS
jgi:CubicO group peptidase (beta-lactamase class C family)